MKFRLMMDSVSYIRLPGNYLKWFGVGTKRKGEDERR